MVYISRIISSWIEIMAADIMFGSFLFLYDPK